MVVGSTQLEVLNEYERQQIGERQPLPERYLGVSDEELEVRISAARLALGDRLVILGHHYQRDEVFKFADYSGDSFKLAKVAAERSDTEFIIFCGVHFMAESADVLSAPYQRVILPDLSAGCSMADMAAADELEVCWRELEELGVTDVVPVTYMNSAADIKAFCGREGGVVCTSSNSVATLRWGWERGEKILFLPDQHLGRNTAYSMGVPLDEMVVWDPQQPMGGLRPDEVAAAKLILWRGHCSVHTRFSVAQIEQLRLAEPEVRVIVHPECTWEVVQAADASGSTDTIIQRIRESAVGSVWAVGTEIHLVNRLAKEMAPSRTVLTLDGLGCLCSTMFRVSPNHLCWVLESLIEGEVHNQVEVPDDQKHWTRVALDRMLSIQ
ncbi:MAG: quinolinate synthase NadA [Vicinamibacterales bacterium]|jgi:quinolinate synthase|nr:quinolinate synthase [Acidobacteriota bacterium]MDP7210384.1 quinolinate synthase NadA [Vicinamibacterales bacterium]HJO17261.1 quinolinate synthase NadA [Vicinamibacterales bacterium]|tara:strand:+ start:69496 stop:70641 length:1146 start_codon:yes stop_codon:yes gene_type:complete